MTFITRSGSTYELDAEQQRIRRVSGARASRDDGVWREYEAITEIRRGSRVLVQFPGGLDDTMLTSSVVEVQP